MLSIWSADEPEGEGVHANVRSAPLRRRPFGWLVEDGSAFLERGAPMSSGVGNSWQVWLRADLIGGVEVDAHDFGMPLLPSWTDPCRRLDGLSGDRRDGDAWYIHRYDAGSLGEARETAAGALLHR